MFYSEYLVSKETQEQGGREEGKEEARGWGRVGGGG